MNWFLPPYKAHVFLAECSNVSTWPFLVGSFLVNWLLSVWPWPFQHHGCPPSAVWPGWQTSAACQHITLAVQMQTHSFSITHKHKCAELGRDVTENRELQDSVSVSGCNNTRSCILFRLAVWVDGKQDVAPCENVLMEIAFSHVVNDVFNIWNENVTSCELDIFTMDWLFSHGWKSPHLKHYQM